MKIHTVKKYLSNLTRKTERNLLAHYKLLQDEVCEELHIKPIKSITLVVAGQDADYTAQAVSAAMTHAGINSATINFDIDCPPDEAVTVNGQKIGAVVASRIITVIRDVERNLVSRNPDTFSTPSAYEVFLLAALCACAQQGGVNIALSFDSMKIPTAVAALIPQPKMICCNAIYPEETECIAAVARRNVEEIISSPQQKDSRLALAALCSEINCNHTVVARGEIEVGAPTYRGIPFSYRNFSAIVATHMKSMIVVPVTALVTIRELNKVRVKLNDDDAFAAINHRKIPGRGQLLSVRPLVISCICDPSDSRFAGYIANDLACLVVDKNRQLDLIIQSSNEPDSEILRALEAERESGLSLGKTVVVLDGQDATHTSTHTQICATSFEKAMEQFDYLSSSTLGDDRLLVLLGDKDFISGAAVAIEDAVRDNFVY